MRIAITGATGLVGRHLCQLLSEAGHSMVAWYRRDPATAPDLPGVTWVPGQLGDAADAEELVRGVDAVIHSGLHRSGPSFLDAGGDPLDYWQRNVQGSLQLLEAASAAGVRRFLFVSSGAVHDRVLGDRPLDETHPHCPDTLYGAYKASVESLIHHYGKSGKLISATVRPTAIYGVATPPEESKWFDLVRAVGRGEAVSPIGGSKSVHAADVARALSLLLQQDPTIAGETYNCCDRMISDHEVATIAKRLTGSASVIAGKPKTAKHQIETGKIRALGMEFGGNALLEKTIAELLAV